MQFPHVIALDFEATCDISNNNMQMEIIEFGASKFDLRSNQEIGEFQSFVRPTIHHPDDIKRSQKGIPLPETVQLSEYCKQLTTITQEMVDTAPLFPAVFHSFIEWGGGPHNIFWCSWGQYDKNQMVKDCRRHRIPYYDYFTVGSHFNLKEEYQVWAGDPKRRGLRAAVESLGIDWQGTQHRALVDAKHVIRVLQVMHSRNAL